MISPEEPTTPQPPNPAHELALCARDLWEVFGGQWMGCIHCANLEQETCGLKDWRGCELMEEALVDAGNDGPIM